jgi:hypothetical protein
MTNTTMTAVDPASPVGSGDRVGIRRVRAGRGQDRADRRRRAGESDTLDPRAVGASVGQLFDWYQEHPELLRLLLWEALETGAEPLPGEEERRQAYRENVRGLVEAGVGAGRAEPERTREAPDWMFTLIGLVAWNFAVPQLRRLILDEDDEGVALARRRAALVEAVHTLAQSHQHSVPADALSVSTDQHA